MNEALMIKKYVFIFLITIILFLSQTDGYASDWRFPLGLSYVHGFNDVVDYYEFSEDADIFSLPVGISFHPYYNFDFGLRIGMGMGPLSLIFIQYIGGGDDKYFLNLPLNFTVGYTVLPMFNISPYVRGGVIYHAATGDYLTSSKPGLFGAVGLEFLRKKRVGFGFEIAVDKAKMEFSRDEEFYYYHFDRKTEVEPGQVFVSIFVVF